MKSYNLDQLATSLNFDEDDYLIANPDVAEGVKNGTVESGRTHFERFAEKEGRMLRRSSVLSKVKQGKLEKIAPLLRWDMPHVKKNGYYDFLTLELRREFNIVDTNAVSSNNYDQRTLAMFEKNKDGVILDCGAGKRQVYFDNIVNFEIVPYDTTDVRGVGEELPFINESFDAVISSAVLEHVKNPFLCAKEIARVLKPDGDLICCVPFLQPFHGYPHHYYNMTYQGLRNLFDATMTIDSVEVYGTLLPIWSLSWILNSWVEGLDGSAREEFLNMKVSELAGSPQQHLDRAFVNQLPIEKNLELASACVLFARKKR
jgi:SAM-dependent methyltransferase